MAYSAYPATTSVGSTAFTASDAVVGAPDGNGTIVSGASTAGSIVSLAIPDGMQTWILLLKAYVSGTIYTEASTNSTNGTDGDWVEVKGRRTGTAPGTESVVYAMVANGYYRGNCSGFRYLRARLIGATGPTARFELSTALGPTFLNSGIPAGSSSIGSVTSVDVTSSGTLAAAAQTVGLSMVGGMSAASAQITGTWVGTIQFEGTVDGTTWVPINGVFASTVSPGVTTTANGIIRFTPSSITSIRLNMTAWTSGTATINMRAGLGTGGTFLNQSLPVGVNNVGSVTLGPLANSAVVNKSGTITTGGTAQVLAAANASRTGLTVQNTHASADLWLTEDGTTTAALNTGYKLAAGAAAKISTQKSISIWGNTTGQTFAATEY